MRSFLGIRSVLGAGAALVALASPALAAPGGRPSLQDSFRLGGQQGALCQIQSTAVDPAIVGMFDRAYAIVCRDAATPIGRIYALRTNEGDPAARLQKIRAERSTCGAATGQATLDDVGAVSVSDCKLKDNDVEYRVYSAPRAKTLYVAEGLTGYDSALTLGLRTIATDRMIEGTVDVATTAVSDPAAFARVQAGTLDLESALAEGYRRNNSGSYAEAAEFFDALLQRAEGGKISQAALGEYVINRALQKSNLGEFAEADALFDQAAKIPTSDPVQLRLRRNFMAMHLINQRKLAEATAELERPLAPVGRALTVAAPGEIDVDAAAELNSGVPLVRQLGGTEATTLTLAEKAAILDAQALQLRGTVLRLQGQPGLAREAFTTTLAQLMAIREGRVTSITRLRAQTMAELSAVAEAAGNYGEAEALLRDGLGLLRAEYPRSIAVSASEARLAAYHTRRGQNDTALGLYRDVINSVTENGGTTSGFENLLGPYFALLAGLIPKQPALVEDFFLASETLVRPGVADTQAILARELSGGSDDASRLFRQSVTLTRDIERARVEYARLASLAAPTPDDQARMATVQESLRALEADQVATQAKLGQYPRYRAVSTQAMALGELQKALRPGEAYLKLVLVGNALYGIWATPTEATAYRAGVSASDLDRKVDRLRNTISVEENGERLTYPFDLKLARELYVELMSPIGDRLTGVNHLVFEPAGAMLRLPPSLLVTEQAGVDAYYARLKKPKADDFDFRDVAWLARRAEISTAVSPRAFRDVRAAAPSAAKHEFLGLGQNAPVNPFVQLTSSRSVSAEGAVNCDWPLEAWNAPIKATELKTAESIIGGGESAVITGAAFSDTAVLAKPDLNQYRILHFATHGLVTAPRPECPARPALLTSFGGEQSDGLLTFKEIYDLRLDADLVILSACDTAGKATVAATREAGVTSGGGNALDGLVRAFIGAGGRSVLASHWPAPDDFQATERLIAGLYEAKPGTSIAGALKTGQLMLMADAATSHPYYWADFVIIGDGAQPVLKPR
ncbi:CHAT domain-containing protein [Sphingomonas sp. DBB INV C78]|uniref:CHAT domain-containing protein n=1 Tax=Sphingomonas sp. DBB INV C78 TaxID=3349434 RepID=UPI0036D35B0E